MITANSPLMGSNILLAVTGSVAACKADRIIRELSDYGAEVQVLLTDSGKQFFPPQTAGSLTNKPVLMEQFDREKPGSMEHIRAKNEIDCLLVAPATANRLLQIEDPDASDMLGTILLAYSGPVLYAPAMNPDMWSQSAVQEIIDSNDDQIILPEKGEMACGEEGSGRLADPGKITERIAIELWPNPLEDVRTVISSGPTREPLDDVRYLTNRSTGRMGEALARVAFRLGANPKLVSGTDTFHYGEPLHPVRTIYGTEEMFETVKQHMEGSDLYVGAAAVSDYRPKPREGKIRSQRDDLALELESTVDIISTIREKFPEKKLVGFSADDAKNPEIAKSKANKKGLDAVIFNSINQDNGAFGSDLNNASLCLQSGKIIRYGTRSKLSLALQIWISLIDHGLIQQ